MRIPLSSYSSWSPSPSSELPSKLLRIFIVIDAHAKPCFTASATHSIRWQIQKADEDFVLSSTYGRSSPKARDPWRDGDCTNIWTTAQEAQLCRPLSSTTGGLPFLHCAGPTLGLQKIASLGHSVTAYHISYEPCLRHMPRCHVRHVVMHAMLHWTMQISTWHKTQKNSNLLYESVLT